MIKKYIKSKLKARGFEIKKIQSKESLLNKSLTMSGAIKRCVDRGLDVNTIIDIGASDGRWTRDCLQYLPQANYLLIEAQAPHEEGLLKLKEEFPKVDYVLAAAGKEKGTIYFNNSVLFGGLASEKPFKFQTIEVPLIAIDDVIKDKDLKGPYVLKLDTHGYEVPILEGAKNTILNAELIIIEAYNYKLTQDSLIHYQLCDYMSKLGFSSIEMVDLVLREHDSSFWQMDIFFVRSDSKEFQHTAYL